jgi:hypothetical protein
MPARLHSRSPRSMLNATRGASDVAIQQSFSLARWLACAGAKQAQLTSPWAYRSVRHRHRHWCRRWVATTPDRFGARQSQHRTRFRESHEVRSWTRSSYPMKSSSTTTTTTCRNETPNAPRHRFALSQTRNRHPLRRPWGPTPESRPLPQHQSRSEEYVAT